MKKIILALMVLLALFSNVNAVSSNDSSGLDGGTYYIFCGKYNGQSDVVNSGNGLIVTCKDYLSELNYCKDVQGISVRFSGEFSDVESIKQKLGLLNVKTEKVGNITNIYGYSFFVNGGILTDNVLINVQISYNGNVINVGTPILLGSY